MTPRHRTAIVVMVVAAALAAAAILRIQPGRGADPHGHADAHGHDHGAPTAATGPHGGELLRDGDFSLEIRIVEDGAAPRFKVWLGTKDKPLPASAAQVTVTVNRPDGQQQEVSFQPAGDALLSVQSIPEPHVFEATIAAQTSKEPYLFTYSRQEGLVAMTDEQVTASGLVVEAARPEPIRTLLELPGEIQLNGDRTAHVSPRITGIVEAVPVNLGQDVRKGQVLAVLIDQRAEAQLAKRRLEAARVTHDREKQLFEEKVTARQDFLQAQAALREAEIAAATATQNLELRAPFDGTIVEKKIAVGEVVKDDTPVFALSNLATVWATASVPSQYLSQVRVGREVTVRSRDSVELARGRVSYVSALIGEQTRTAQARVVLDNPGLAWRPGLLVTVEVTTGQGDASITVPAEAVQSLQGRNHVFLKVPGGFVPQAVEVGRNDGRRVEILKGIAAGTQVAARGSFVIKAEQGKSQAGHGH